ncbi:MAG: hypothetical protein H0T47_12375 [Planctomycetaceae bacterium]|nr:hypothetical protein [Planctomycetaceae bacterium]
MAEDLYPVRLVSHTGGELAGVFVLDEDEPGDDCTLILRSSLGEFTAKEWNYFAALCRIREQLEEKGWRPVCYGSSRKVYPSGMCCDMGRGLTAYRMEMGRQAFQRDQVRVFDSGPDVESASVDEQEKFRDAWLQSLGGSK